ncbi:MAG: hypothetical protein AABX79_00760 [Nanoarchaeota archaeon]
MANKLESRVKGLGRKNIPGRYNGFKTPLDFFRANKRYHNLTRHELSENDPGLYRTLLRHGQLEEAIPDVMFESRSGRPPLSKEEIEKIAQIYSQTRSITKTACLTWHSWDTISKYLIHLGIKIKSKSRPEPLPEYLL